LCKVKIDNLDVPSVEVSPDLYRRYLASYNKLACRNLGWVEGKVVGQQYGYQGNFDVWHIATQLETYPILHNMLKKHYPERLFNRGLDIGCGTVSFFDWEKVDTPVLMDICMPYCVFMKNKFKHILQGDVERLPFPTKSVDLVVCSDVLEHVLSFDTALSEIERVLCDKGVFLINVPWGQNIQNRTVTDFSHIRRFDDTNMGVRFSGWVEVCRQLIDKEKRFIPTMNFIFTKKDN